jgi:hypothetical protein
MQWRGIVFVGQVLNIELPFLRAGDLKTKARDAHSSILRTQGL